MLCVDLDAFADVMNLGIVVEQLVSFGYTATNLPVLLMSRSDILGSYYLFYSAFVPMAFRKSLLHLQMR